MKIFVSFPLSHADPLVVEQRVKIAKAYCLELFKQGHIPFTPAITGLAILDGDKGIDITYETWKDFCIDYLKPCDVMHILTLDGYEQSVGVIDEMMHASRFKIPVEHIDMTEYQNKFVQIVSNGTSEY